jgi:hypothetical protein
MDLEHKEMNAITRKIVFAVKSALRTFISVAAIGLVIMMFTMPSIFGIAFIAIGGIVSMMLWGFLAGLFEGVWMWLAISKIEKKAGGEK